MGGRGFAIGCLAGAALALGACGSEGSDDPSGAAAKPDLGSDPATLVVYSARGRDLTGELLEEFTRKTGIEHEARYGDTLTLAEAIVKEGRATPADILIFEDVGALGDLDSAGGLDLLPADIQDRIPDRYNSGYWIGTSARVRAIAFDRERIAASAVPDSVLDLTEPEYADEVGWAPKATSFQTFVSGLRRTEGERGAERWLREMKANGARAYADDGAIVDAIALGEIRYGLVDRQSVVMARARDASLPVGVHEPTGGDPGALVTLAGIAQVENASPDRDDGEAFIRFVLSRQARIVAATKEYPIVPGRGSRQGSTPLAAIEQPDVHPSELGDLEGSRYLLRRLGIL